MQLNPNTIKLLRQKHNWTQQLLADACDVSLRTIQRVEKEGAASKETTMSLCSVFEVRQGELIKLDNTETAVKADHKKVQKLYLIIILSSLISFGLGMSSVLLFVK
ncbi:helix-turn-helix transcriptional regulator [Paraglaciecola marina]|uniref:helix-turn-helix transcriptional regulator n=1 Tax=Paraglaciecola marina TaxID=2500157 RepID=UPI00105E5C2D|nr:helix-turn-helix transcriptional regulator [Paraglaciecola marina]